MSLLQQANNTTTTTTAWLVCAHMWVIEDMQDMDPGSRRRGQGQVEGLETSVRGEVLVDGFSACQRFWVNERRPHCRTSESPIRAFLSQSGAVLSTRTIHTAVMWIHDVIIYLYLLDRRVTCIWLGDSVVLVAVLSTLFKVLQSPKTPISFCVVTTNPIIAHNDIWLCFSYFNTKNVDVYLVRTHKGIATLRDVT